MKKPKIAILCGGSGKRLKHITSKLPKPLVPLRNKPILEHILDFFKQKKFNEFILCIGYKGGQIREFIRKYNSSNSCKFCFSDLGAGASILQRVYALKEYFDDRIFCTYGDTLTDLSLDELFECHLKKKALMTITASKIRSPFGLLEMDQNGWAKSFVEKPIFNYYIGHFLMEKAVLELVTTDMLKEPDGSGLISLFLKLIELKKLSVFEHYGAQITFNTESERINAAEEVINFYSQNEEV